MANTIKCKLSSFAYSSAKLCYQALQIDCNASAEKRGIVSLIGPSGCGKSSICNTLAGLNKSAQYSITPANLKISYMFQQPRLMPWLTVRQNIQLVLPQTNNELISEWLERLHLLSIENESPLHLSGGMQRRVAMARAFIVSPDLLLLDEPFTSLDAPTAQECRDLLVELCRESECKALLVTHDIQEAIYIADTIMFLSSAPASLIYTWQKPHNIHELMALHPNILSGYL